jgi:hypothetical protein
MANLRIISINATDSTDITATFTQTLSEDIGAPNVQILSQTPGVPNSEVQSANVSANTLQIVCQPLTPLASYFIIFISTSSVQFKSLNGTYTLPMDGVTNQQLIIGPITTANPIQQYLINYFQYNVYNLENDGIISNWINGLATLLAQTLYAIRQSGNENYLSYTITDELHIYDGAPFDRLNEESAYEVLRVGLTPTGTTSSNLTPYSSFPAYEVSLLATSNTEQLIVNDTNDNGTFNINTLTLNLSEMFVIIVSSIVFVYNNNTQYVYNIPDIGYQILNSNYDPNYAFTFLALNNNQVVLNSSILSDPSFSTNNISYVQVVYQYKDTGKIIDPTSLVIDTVLSSGREVVPPIENVFTLDHAPIVASNDADGSVGDVDFIDPNAIPGSGNPHPAFIYEIPFNFNYLPSIPGQYSVDYSNGNVYVYGATSLQDGTGPYPPIAVYYYRYVFTNQIDYSYDVDTSDIAPLPNGSLIGSSANIAYNYEEVLAEGIDYKASTHIESLNEAIDNRLVALNQIQPLNFPITDVFKIFNQTTGEIYNILRWSDTSIYFTYNIAPNIQSIVGETISFQNVLNEVLYVSSISTISPSINLFIINLQNNNITNLSQDAIGSSFNTSVNFSNQDIFTQEIYFDDNLTIAQNNLRLINIGNYQIDYANGVIYLYAASTQGYNIGTVSYKDSYIATNNDNIISVVNIYYRFSVLSQVLKTFAYNEFTDTNILPIALDVSNEEFLNGNNNFPYYMNNGQVGTFYNSIFTAGVSQPIYFIRSLFEYDDLLNNVQPINFAGACTFSNNVITVAPLVFTEYHSVQYNGTNYFLTANTNLLYLSPEIFITVSVIRLSDQAQLWNSSGTIQVGAPFTLILPGINSPHTNDSVILTYSYTIDTDARIVVDYSKGDFLVDYNYLYDDILISYEYGDNSLDFRQSNALSIGETYYVSYKVGALRDALLKNFGTLINIPLLNTLDVNLDREDYRNALIAAMQSFTAGPTIASMENIVQTIVHTPPQIIESAFQNWTLGQSLLNPEPIDTTGNLALVPGKYANGVLMNTPGQTITFPVCSNLRLEEGSLSCWVIPQWNGLDNQSNLYIQIFKNGIPLPAYSIFIGPAGYHPAFTDGYYTFGLNTSDNVLGKPSESVDGVFIYYAPDQSGLYNRWYIDVADSYADDGYAAKTYNIYVNTNGRFYDVKSSTVPQPSTMSITSGTNTLLYNINAAVNPRQGITFLADNHHYIFDFGQSEGCNRFSIYKDESGYINFRIIDKNKKQYLISSNISDWTAGEKHFIATSWALNTRGGQDEMHLFIDGFEVPNNILYGNPVSPYLDENFRTIDPEEIVGVVDQAIVSSIDLQTTSGSENVFSSINFSTLGVLPGGTIYINEPGFNPNGYTITFVNGQTLTLNTAMPLTITNGNYNVNKLTFDVLYPVDLYPNITVSLLHTFYSFNDLTTILNNDVVMSSSSNFTVLGVLPGYLINIIGASFTSVYTIVSVSNDTLILNTEMPAGLSNLTYYIYANNPIEIPGTRALYPAYSVGRDGYCNSEITLLNDAEPNDIVLIQTLGLNSQKIFQKPYVWSSLSNPDGYVNIIKTMLPRPILLCNVDITHILLDRTNINSGNVGTEITGLNPPSVSDNGRTLALTVYSTNINYSDPFTITVNGTVGNVPNVSNTVSFTEDGTQNTTSQFQSVNYITVNCTPVNSSLNYCVVSVKEAYPITTAQNSITAPVIRYSYQMQVGNTLSGIGGTYTITDENNLFSVEEINNYVLISSPGSVIGQYQITGVSTDHHSLTLSSPIPATFSNGIYQVLNVSTYSSGLQNGFFTFENASTPGVPYYLAPGAYEFNYYSYISIPISLGILNGYIGTDINGNNVANATIDEFQTVGVKLTDVRTGEMAQANTEYITTDFNSLKALQPNINTLMLLHFDTFPFENAANVYITASNQFIQSSNTINSNFDASIVLTKTPYVIDNTGILHADTQATIEFWVNPLQDTGNDPNYRYYFDASANISEQVVSVDNTTVVVNGPVSQVLNVILQAGNQSIDYFAGGSVDSDLTTINLRKVLPNQNTAVIVNYIPQGAQGDRLSIFKDPYGYINFNVIASNIQYTLRSPCFWTKNSWHRLKAEFIFNTGLGSDEIRFFIDGYERGNVLFQTNLLFGQTEVYGSSYVGQSGVLASIQFKDTINQFFLGSDYSGTNLACCLMNNLRVSDIARPIFMPFGESIDVNYSSNLNVVFPVQSDLYTTLLMNFGALTTLNTNFATLKNRDVGIFDFTVNIYDQFNVLSSNPIVQEILEDLINTLKPASARAFINISEPQ